MLFTESFLRKLERLSVMSRRAMSGQLHGERRSSKRGQSVEFADFRPYTPGDDFRRIDWNAYARMERFFLKLFVEEEDLTVHILVDVSRSMNWGQPNKLTFALRTAGALGYITLAGLDRVTATALGKEKSVTSNWGTWNIDYFAPHRGKQSANALFTFLERYLPDNAPIQPASIAPVPLSSVLQSYATRSTSPGPFILISDLFETPSPNQPEINSSIFQSLNVLASNGYEVTLIHTLSPEEVEPNLIGDLKLQDSESGAEVEITADFDLLQRYRNGVAEWQSELRSFCGTRNMNYVPVETTLPLEELIFAWMRQYSVLK